MGADPIPEGLRWKLNASMWNIWKTKQLNRSCSVKEICHSKAACRRGSFHLLLMTLLLAKTNCKLKTGKPSRQPPVTRSQLYSKVGNIGYIWFAVCLSQLIINQEDQKTCSNISIHLLWKTNSIYARNCVSVTSISHCLFSIYFLPLKIEIFTLWKVQIFFFFLLWITTVQIVFLKSNANL